MPCSLKCDNKRDVGSDEASWEGTPDPGFGPQVELSVCDAGGLVDLLGIGKGLADERIAAEKPTPAHLEIEPACPGGRV